MIIELMSLNCNVSTEHKMGAFYQTLHKRDATVTECFHCVSLFFPLSYMDNQQLQGLFIPKC